MADLTPTRSLVIALADERRTMREGYAFLDEKCLLLAGEMLQMLRRDRARRRELADRQAQARRALRAAIARHGLNGLQVYPAAPLALQLSIDKRSLLGVTMQSERVVAEAATGAAPAEAINPSPEAEACRHAYAALLPLLAELAVLSGNLARLHAEYKKTVRRVRALQDVLLPEIELTLADIETRLEELEQDEAAVLRRAAQSPAAAR